MKSESRFSLAADQWFDRGEGRDQERITNHLLREKIRSFK
jgi:hypothetical protein